MNRKIRYSNQALIAIFTLISVFGISSCSYNTYPDSTDIPVAEADGAGNVGTGGGGTGGGGMAVSKESKLAEQQRGFVVQLFASAFSYRADEIKDDFIREGYNTFVNKIVRNGKTLYRVQVGPYKAEQDANRALHEMQNKYYQNEIVELAFVNENK